MTSSNLTIIVHAIVGLAIIGAVAALGAVGTITGEQAMTAIAAVTGLLLGAGGVTVGNALSNTSTPTPPTTSPAMPPKQA